MSLIKEKNAPQNLDVEVKAYAAIADNSKVDLEELFKVRSKCSSELISRVEGYINDLANSPKDLDKSWDSFLEEIKKFDGVRFGWRA